MSSVWETLSKVDVSDHTEEKNGLTYLSWAWAWGEVKNAFPDRIKESRDMIKNLIDEGFGIRVGESTQGIQEVGGGVAQETEQVGVGAVQEFKQVEGGGGVRSGKR